MCQDIKATDLAILDMRGLVYYTDMFLLCSGSNSRHVQAIADEVRRCARKDLNLEVRGVEGKQNGRWVLVDLIDVVVHIFDADMRPFYDLDGLWGDAPRLPIPEEEPPEEPQYGLP